MPQVHHRARLHMQGPCATSALFACGGSWQKCMQHTAWLVGALHSRQGAIAEKPTCVVGIHGYGVLERLDLERLQHPPETTATSGTSSWQQGQRQLPLDRVDPLPWTSKHQWQLEHSAKPAGEPAQRAAQMRAAGVPTELILPRPAILVALL